MEEHTQQIRQHLGTSNQVKHIQKFIKTGHVDVRHPEIFLHRFYGGKVLLVWIYAGHHDIM